MSLSTLLHWLHEEKCKFTLSSSEVRDIESSVYEGLSAILQKGQAINFKLPLYVWGKTDKIPSDEEDRVRTFGDLFSVEKILPIGSFFEKTKIILPNEFDFNIMLNVGEIDIHPGCRPGRVQVSFESSRQIRLENLEKLFRFMIENALETISPPEKNIRRDSGTLLISSHVGGGVGKPQLSFKWKGINSEFDIHVDVMPAFSFTDNFIAELGENEHFPSKFHQLVKDHPCYLVPKPCSRICGKCFHVSFAQAELYLMQSLDERHRQCYRVMKLLLADNILDSYKLKMAVLDHVYNTNCQSKESIDDCVLAMLDILLHNYNELILPSFFMRNCCVITKDGEGAARYLDYLVDVSGLDLVLPLLPTDFESNPFGHNNYDLLDMFAWYEFQRRCISFMTDVLRFFSQVEIGQGLGNGTMLASLEVFLVKRTSVMSTVGRKTTREWRDKVPNFSQRVFIPAFSQILDEIQVILKRNFVVPGVWSTPPIQLCLPCPVMGYSQGSVGSYLWREGDHMIRHGAICYFARLEGSSWCPVAFGKMSFIEDIIKTLNDFFFIPEQGQISKLVRRNSLTADATDDSTTNGDEIPDFCGPFHYNVRYDGEAFQENIVSCWHYKRRLICFLLYRMVIALYLRFLKTRLGFI